MLENLKQPVCSQQKTVPEQKIEHSYIFILHHEQVSGGSSRPSSFFLEFHFRIQFKIKTEIRFYFISKSVFKMNFYFFFFFFFFFVFFRFIFFIFSFSFDFKLNPISIRFIFHFKNLI